MKAFPVINPVAGYCIANSNVSRQSIFPKDCLDRAIIIVISPYRFI